MAVTYSGFALDEVKGPYQGAPVGTPLHLFRVAIQISGTYATGGANADLCNAFVAASGAGGARMGVTAINVLWAKAFGDYYDGTNSYDVDNSSISLSSGGSVTSISSASTNNLVTIKLYSGTNGSGGSEITNATAVNGWVGLVFAAQVTYGSLGVA